MDAILDFILELYRTARSEPPTQFPDRALQMLRRVVPFRSAMWSDARYAGRSLEIYTAHPFDEPPEMLDEFVEFNRMHPITVAEVSKLRGRPRTFYAPVLYSGRELAGFSDYVRRYGHERHLLAADIEAPDARGNWLSLYRPDGWEDFGDRDRRWISILMPHLSEAFAINRYPLLQHGVSAQPAEVGLRALIALDGRILYCGNALFDLVGAEWPEWPGVRLPEPLLVRLVEKGSARIAGGAMRICASQLGDALLLTARKVMGGERPSAPEKAHIALDANGIELLIEALEALSLAAFVCDRNANVVAITASGRALATQGGALSLANGRLVASFPGEARALNDAFALAAEAQGIPAASAARTVILDREGRHGVPVVLDVVPLRSGRLTARFRDCMPRALAVARDSRAGVGRKAAILCATYGLTSTEAEIALSVASGTPAQRIAERRAVAVGTIRNQIKTILAKVGVHRQVELAARVAHL